MRVRRVEVRVEGTGGGGIVCEEVKVCVIFLEDKAAKCFFVGRTVKGQLLMRNGCSKKQGPCNTGMGKCYLISSSAEASMPASLSILMPAANRSRGAGPSGI